MIGVSASRLSPFYEVEDVVEHIERYVQDLDFRMDSDIACITCITMCRNLKMKNRS